MIDGSPVPILVWAADVDEPTLAQTRNLAALPFAFHHVALMPDAHVGYGMPIGGVFAALGQVVPHAVGLDIGCGVRCCRTVLPVKRILDVRDAAMSDVMRSVPSGHEWHREAQAAGDDLFDDVPDSAALKGQLSRAALQLGSLGGGNHFIEIQRDEAGMAWLMVHSGSRNVGKQMAEHFDAVARAECERTASTVPPAWGLAHLACDGDAGREYLAVMGWCLRFARANRAAMMRALVRAVGRRLGPFEPAEELDIHHNYAAVETHFGREVIVHRKGAVRAVGTVLVPGSMGTSSYVGRGLASPDSFESCSHGAGRAMGRKAALSAIPRERVVEQLRQADIRLFKAKKRDLAEEAPEAYKDIDDVMSLQRDLVEPLVRLTPIGVYKG